MTMLSTTTMNFLHEHREGLTLFAMAVVVSMQEKLPWPFSRVEALEWGYEWMRKSLLTFISLRGPAHSEASVQTSSTVTGKQGETVDLKKTVTASSSGVDSNAKGTS